MKKVISVSLGSSSRDHKGILQLGNEKIEMSREGVDGDAKLCKKRFEELDGTVDCFGAGGFMFAFHIGDKVYRVKQADKLISGIKKTPIVDGTGIKKTIERISMQESYDQIKDIFEDEPKTAFMSTAVDRWEMACSLADVGLEIICGDFMFGLGLPIAVKGLDKVPLLASIVLPFVRRFPMRWIYPTGSSQDVRKPKYKKFYERATVIAGDYLYTKKYAPDNLDNKIILTNTTTAEDIDSLKDKGVAAVITTTPRVQGRSFGTNVLEAAVTAYSGLNRQLTEKEMKKCVDELGLKAQVHRF